LLLFIDFLVIPPAEYCSPKASPKITAKRIFLKFILKLLLKYRYQNEVKNELKNELKRLLGLDSNQRPSAPVDKRDSAQGRWKS
jgi:hypothetical protein